eukprot:Hpha_TRINITY_DN16384_c3_g2::TRINITY_DN16384_c3_g2_i2::g.62947::m.62947
MAMEGGCRWGWFVRQGDTPDEAKIKTRMFPFAIFDLFAAVFIMVTDLQGNNQMVLVIGYVFIIFSLLQFMVGVVSNALPAGYLLDVLLVMCAVDMCLMDLGSATRSYDFRSWTFVVLALDCALIFKRYHMPLFII